MSTLPSDRKFGLFITFIFIFASSYSWLKYSTSPMFYGCLSFALFLLVVTVVSPHLLHSLNRAWFLLGLAMGKIVSPLVLGFIFYVLLTPVSILTRMFGRDELRLKKQSAHSYWVVRPKSNTVDDPFKNQF
jgi:hypothetical protein